MFEKRISFVDVYYENYKRFKEGLPFCNDDATIEIFRRFGFKFPDYKDITSNEHLDEIIYPSVDVPIIYRGVLRRVKERKILLISKLEKLKETQASNSEMDKLNVEIRPIVKIRELTLVTDPILEIEKEIMELTLEETFNYKLKDSYALCEHGKKYLGISHRVIFPYK